jgi:phage baseplate assembly protein gpV
VTAKSGEPSTEGKEQNLPVLGRKGAWVKYETADHVLHVESAVGSGDICMVTLMAPDAAYSVGDGVAPD